MEASLLLEWREEGRVGAGAGAVCTPSPVPGVSSPPPPGASARVQAVPGSRGRTQFLAGHRQPLVGSGQSAIREMRRRSQEARTPRHRSRHPALCKHWPRSEAPCVFCMNEAQ